MKKITLLLSAMLFAMMSMAATTVTMDFTSQAGLENLGIAYPVDSTTTEGAFQTELVAGQAYTQEGVSLTATHGSTPTRVWLAASGALDLRHYKTGVLTFAAPAGKVILKVKMGGGNVAGFADAPSGLWTGEANTVALTADASAKTIKISTIEVTYGESGETLEPEDPKDTELVIPEEAKAWNIPAEAIDVLKAREICAGLASGATSGTKYYVMGYVKKIHSKHADGVANYGNAQFYMENVKGANSMDDFMAYQVYGLNGEKITDPNVVAVGDFVVVYGELTNYNGTYETTGKGSAYIWNSTNSLIGNTTPSNEVTVTGLAYGEAYYYESDNAYEFMLYNFDEATEELLFPIVMVGVEAKSKTAINGTYDLIAAMYATGVNANDEAEGVLMGEELGTLTIKNVDSEGNYSFVGSFVGEDGKTYKLNTVANVYAIDDETGDDIELKEETETPPTPPTDGAIVFDADVDMGNATTDYNQAAAFQVSKNGVTLDVTKGCIGVYNNENHYRIYKNETLTVTSTAGNIAKIEFTCTANGDEKYGPGCFTASTGEYGHDGAAVGTWTGDAATVTFTASTNQVRATQIVVTLASATAVEDVTVGATPVKVIENGQLMIIRGEKVYNVLGAQVK